MHHMSRVLCVVAVVVVIVVSSEDGASGKTKKQTVILSRRVEEIPAENYCRKKNDFAERGCFFGDLLADTQISGLDSQRSSRGPS